MDPNFKELAFNTKTICLCTITSILLIVMFVLSPLSQYLKTSLFMKLIIVGVLGYTLYLSVLQINVLKASSNSESKELINQLNMNMYSNYVFIVFLCILIFLLAKSFF